MLKINLLHDKEIYIWGSGQRGMALYSLLEERDIHVRAFIDSNKEKQGTLIHDKKCFGINDVIFEKNYCVLVTPKNHTASIFEQLREKGIDMNNVYTWDTIYQLLYFLPIVQDPDDFKYAVPFNRYDSPYPDIREIHKKEVEIFDSNKDVLDIDFNIQRQLELMAMMINIDNPPWQKQKLLEYRYYYDQKMFGKGSADVLYYMIRILKPNRIIEVGSGFSTAVMLDVNEIYFENRIEINAIEPYADRLKSLLKKNDNIRLQECFVQDISLEFFEQLQENDILFIDSSHMARVNSDVNYIMFEILPRLNKGVYIHFHDIFYPFEYPKEWIYQGIVYNEMYLLRAFLMNNTKYSIQFFGHMLMKTYSDKLNDKFQNLEGSIWIKKEI